MVLQKLKGSKTVPDVACRVLIRTKNISTSTKRPILHLRKALQPICLRLTLAVMVDVIGQKVLAPDCPQALHRKKMKPKAIVAQKNNF